jgi:protein Mpv17
MKAIQVLLFLSLLSTVTSFTPSTSSSRQIKTSTTQRKAFDASTVDAFYQSQPYLAAFLTCGVKAGSADFVAQKQQASQAKNEESQGEREFDVSRNVAFLVYGGLWQGIFQQCLYLHLYPVLFGANPTLESIACQVAFDVLITGPILCIPVSYSVKSMFASGEVSVEAIERGLQNYWRDISTKGLMKTYGSIWVPAQCLTFGVVPPHLRVVFVAAVSFFWVTRLSAISSSSPLSSTTATSSTMRPSTVLRLRGDAQLESRVYQQL